MKAYAYWYKITKTATTEYVYVIALTPKQANFFWFNYLKNVVGYAYDYAINPVNEYDESTFVRKHEAGQIYGENAVI